MERPSARGESGESAPASTRVKDALRDDGDVLATLAETWRAMIEYGCVATNAGECIRYDSAATATRAANTARRFVEWADASLFTGDAFVKTAGAMLGARDPDLARAGADFFAALASKGMDRAAKVALIRRLGLVDACASLRGAAAARARARDGGGGGDDGDWDDADLASAQLAAAVAGELFACLRAAAAAAAAEEANEPHAVGPSPEVVVAASDLVDEILPTCVAHLGGGVGPGGGEAVVMASLAPCTAYVNRLKDPHAAATMPARAKEKAEAFLNAMLEAVITRGSFPEPDGPESRCGVSFADGGDKFVREAEAEVVALRLELGVLFRAIARLAPPLALAAVRAALVRALPPPPSPPAPWQRVETAISALYLIGEGANDGAVKPGVEESPLGELIGFLLERWNGGGGGGGGGDGGGVPASAHRLVASAFLDLCVRYHLAVERNAARLLTPALGAFLDGRGMRHPDPEVSRRACYLFCRFVKPLRQQIAPSLPSVLAALDAVMSDAGAPSASHGGVGIGSGGAGGGAGTGGAMATEGNDDRLYVFEAFGLLLGIEDVPEDSQATWLEAACAPLRIRVESAIASGDAAAARHAVVALSNVAKGFPSRLATSTRPRCGAILQTGLEPALRCLGAWPRDALTRQRVVAFFHRLVLSVGAAVFPYALPLVEHLRSGGGAEELAEALVLLNQLMATFKGECGALVAQTLPAMTSQIALALAPFSGFDGDGVVVGVRGLGAGAGAGASSTPSSSTPATDNTEEAREAINLEKMFSAHVHGLCAHGLIPVLASSEEGLAATREAILSTLTRVASAHRSAASRKMALQTLFKLAAAWVVPADAPPPAAEPVPGFTRFAAETIAPTCCVAPTLRGDLDLRDATSAAAASEGNAITRLLLERRGDAFAADLVNGTLTPLGLGGDVAVEYLRVVRDGSAKDARAFLAECQRVVRGSNPGIAKAPVTRS